MELGWGLGGNNNRGRIAGMDRECIVNKCDGAATATELHIATQLH